MTVQEIRDKNYLVFEVVAGSKLYGTSTDNSDTDTIGVYVLPQRYMLGGFADVEYSKEGCQVFDRSIYRSVEEHTEGKDTIFYELRHFLKLLSNGVPQVIEAILAPEDKILMLAEAFKEIYQKRKVFFTKKLMYTFGYSPYALYEKMKSLSRLTFEKPLTDFFIVLPALAEPAKTLTEFLATRAEADRYILEDAVLYEVPEAENIYTFNYSYDLHYAKIHKCELRAEAKYPGLVLDRNNNPITFISTGQKFEEEYPVTFRHNLFFKKDDYVKYKTLREKGHNLLGDNTVVAFRYNSKRIAHAYRLLNMGIELGKNQRIGFPLTNMVMFNEIKNNRMPIPALDLVFKAMKLRLESLFKDFPEEIDADWIQKLEIAVRGRHAVLGLIVDN